MTTPRKTAAQRRAEEKERADAIIAQRRQDLEAAWPDRLMAALDRATYYGFSMGVRERRFVVEGCTADDASFVVHLGFVPVGTVNVHWEDGDFAALDRLEGYIIEHEAREREQERIRQLRAAGIAKLSTEERETLGLGRY